MRVHAQRPEWAEHPRSEAGARGRRGGAERMMSVKGGALSPYPPPGYSPLRLQEQGAEEPGRVQGRVQTATPPRVRPSPQLSCQLAVASQFLERLL